MVIPPKNAENPVALRGGVFGAGMRTGCTVLSYSSGAQAARTLAGAVSTGAGPQTYSRTTGTGSDRSPLEMTIPIGSNASGFRLGFFMWPRGCCFRPHKGTAGAKSVTPAKSLHYKVLCKEQHVRRWQECRKMTRFRPRSVSKRYAAAFRARKLRAVPLSRSTATVHPE